MGTAQVGTALHYRRSKAPRGQGGVCGYSRGTMGTHLVLAVGTHDRTHCAAHTDAEHDGAAVGVGRFGAALGGPPPPVTTCLSRHVPLRPPPRKVKPNSRRRRRRFAAVQCGGPCAAAPFPLGPIPLGPFPLGPFPLTARFASAQPCHAIPFHSHGTYDTLPNALHCAVVAQRCASAVYALLC